MKSKLGDKEGLEHICHRVAIVQKKIFAPKNENEQKIESEKEMMISYLPMMRKKT